MNTKTTITDATTEAKTETQASSADSTTILTCELTLPSSPVLLPGATSLPSSGAAPYLPRYLPAQRLGDHGHSRPRTVQLTSRRKKDVTGTLGPDITAALDALTAKEAAFAALSLNSLVVTDLQTLQNDTDALGAALVTISSTDVQASAQAAITEVDAAFASAIAVFS